MIRIEALRVPTPRRQGRRRLVIIPVTVLLLLASVPPAAAATVMSACLLDVDGGHLAGGVVTYHSGGWKTLGTTEAGRCATGSVPDSTTRIRISFRGETNETVVNLALGTTVTFRTGRLVQGIGPLVIQWHTTGSWNAFEGVIDLLPGRVSIKLADNSNEIHMVRAGETTVIPFGAASTSPVQPDADPVADSGPSGDEEAGMSEPAADPVADAPSTKGSETTPSNQEEGHESHDPDQDTMPFDETQLPGGGAAEEPDTQHEAEPWEVVESTEEDWHDQDMTDIPAPADDSHEDVPDTPAVDEPDDRGIVDGSAGIDEPLASPSQPISEVPGSSREAVSDPVGTQSAEGAVDSAFDENHIVTSETTEIVPEDRELSLTASALSPASDQRTPLSFGDLEGPPPSQLAGALPDGSHPQSSSGPRISRIPPLLSVEGPSAVPGGSSLPALAAITGLVAMAGIALASSRFRRL